MIGATLCSGIGAPEAAAPWVDWRWHAEIEPFPAAVHAARFPASVNLGDMTAPDLIERAAAIALPDVIVAGTPCQAFSVAGLRGSLADARGNLTLTFVRIVDAIDALRRAAGLAPLWVVWENVPGVFSTSDNAFGAFLGGMVGGDAAVEPPRGRGWTDAGVVSGPARCAAWRVLDAQFFGLAQRRRRVFVLARGGAGDWSAADALLPVTESVRWHPAPRRKARKGIAAGTLRRTDGGSDVDHGQAGHLIPAVSPTLRAGGNATGGDRPPGTDVDTVESLIPLGLGEDGQLARALNACNTASGRHDVSVDTFIAHALTANGFDASEDGTGRGTPLVPVSVALRGRDGGATAEIGDDKAFTLRASSGGGDKPHVLAHAFDARQSDVIQYGDRAGPLDTDGHSQAIAFDTTQITSSANYSNPRPGDPCHPLAAGAHPPAIAFGVSGLRRGGSPSGGVLPTLTELAPTLERHHHGQTGVLTAADHGADAAELAPTLRAMGHSGSHANGGRQVAVATSFYANEGSHGSGDNAGISVPLKAHPKTSNLAAVQSGMAVRRLTPRECERLQGFPDDWTAIEWRGKPAADGPRYKALGNSMAVPVLRYLLERVREVAR